MKHLGVSIVLGALLLGCQAEATSEIDSGSGQERDEQVLGELPEGQDADLQARSSNDEDSGNGQNLTDPAIEQAAGEQLLPVDEASEDESFELFRAELMQAVENEDTEFLLDVVSPDIITGFGRRSGIEDFKERGIENSESQLWQELGTVLKLGGEFKADASQSGEGLPTFVAPYVFSAWDGRTYRAYDYYAVVDDTAVLREAPDATSEPVAALSHHILEVSQDESIRVGPDSYEYSWYKVRTTTGTEGFVAAQSVRSPIDYRAFFEKQDNRWIMTVFLAGD